MSLAVILTFIFVIALEIAIPILIGYLIVKRFGLRWAIFLYGIIFFIIAQAIHIPLLLLLQPPFTAGITSIFSDPALVLAAIALFLGLFAGLLEEGIRYLVFARFFPKKSLPVNRENGLLFGAGWGGIECLFVGILVFFSLVNYILILSGALDALLGNISPSDPVQMAALTLIRNLTPLDILPGLLERIMTLILQIAFTMLVLLTVVKARIIFLMIAIGWHTVVDASAVYMVSTYGIWPTEGMILVNGMLGLGVIYVVWRLVGSERHAETMVDSL